METPSQIWARSQVDPAIRVDVTEITIIITKDGRKSLSLVTV